MQEGQNIIFRVKLILKIQKKEKQDKMLRQHKEPEGKEQG